MAKILFGIDSLVLGGLERQFCLLLKHLPTEWETRVVSLGNGPFTEVLSSQGEQVVIFPRRYRYDLNPVLNTWGIIRKYNPSIFHSWGGLISSISAPVCKIKQIKFISSIRSGGPPKRHLMRVRIVKSLSDKVVANSKAGIDSFKVPQAKEKVIYNALDPDRIDLINKKNKSYKDATTVVMAARMVSEKDFSSFIEAAKIITKTQDSGWKFVALGTGEYRSAYLNKAEQLVNRGIMEFPNAELEIIPYLLKADIGVLLTNTELHQEGFSNSIMEYMACGLPVICSDSGGNKEMVVDQETGFILQTAEVDELVERLLFLSNNPDISKNMGEMGRRRIDNMCSVDHMVDEYVNIYKELLN